MKKIFFFILLSSSVFRALAQEKNTHQQDSVMSVQLNEVVVTSVFQSQSKQIGNFFIANKEATTEDILSRLPEINLIRRGSYGMEPLIRGYNTGQTNILIDGMRIHAACTDKMDPVTIYIEPQNLQNIQVQTTQGFKNGSAVGGSVNLKTAAPDCTCENPFTASISSGYQTAAHAFYETGFLNYHQKKLAIRTNVSYRKAGDYRSGGGAVIPYSQYEKINYGLSAKYELKNSWFAKADVLMDDGWNIGYPALPMDAGYAAARIYAASLLQENTQGKWKNTEFKMYANFINHSMDDTHRKNVVMHMDMPGHSKTFGAYANSVLQFNEKKKLELKADISSTDLDASMTMYPTGQPSMFMLTLPNNRSIQTGVSATYNQQISYKTKYIVSTRVDEFINSLTTSSAENQIAGLSQPTGNIYKTLKNISAQIIHATKQYFQFSFEAAYSERMPTAAELYGVYLFNAFDNYDYIGNTQLQPEQALKAEMTAAYRKKRIQLSVTPFVSKINHYILGIYQPGLSSMTTGANGVKAYSNIPYATIAGVEAAFIYKSNNDIELISTVKYNYGADNNNNPLPLIAPLKNISSIKKGFKNFAVQLETEAATAQNRVSVQANEATTTGYFIANARIFYNNSWKGNKKYRIDFGVENIFDAAYKEHLDWGKINRPGRNVYVQLSVGLGSP
ncbi:MAG: TonB-dependent receptor [Chitinophagaceae bacterium]|jgi:iron complex outermembrane receptor protein|nr:TonB-dependent receptor [Chitinophagaceae bacterium]